jgi:putative addiction module killer protein
VNTVSETAEFSAWLRRLADAKARARIAARVAAVQYGNFGDCKSVGDGVSEMRIDHGPGYRVYFTRVGSAVYILLCGGDKSTQKADIQRAKEMAKRL